MRFLKTLLFDSIFAAGLICIFLETQYSSHMWSAISFLAVVSFVISVFILMGLTADEDKVIDHAAKTYKKPTKGPIYSAYCRYSFWFEAVAVAALGHPVIAGMWLFCGMITTSFVSKLEKARDGAKCSE